MRGNDGTRTGGEILVDQLAIHGVRHAFCVPGESYLAALDAFLDSKIELTVCRHESGAAMMAEAAGKATGRPGICFVTRGPGATNASAGIHIARQDSTPMIVFVGQVARSMREREAFQELDYRAVFGTIAKWATEIDDPARIPELVARAFHTACNGRPGPVVIALPEDMLTERAVVPDAKAFEPVEIWPGLTDMSRLQKLLWAAKRPVALIGGSRWSEQATAALMRFAERFALPVATTFRRGAFVRCAASLLRRRSRHRAQPQAAGAGERRRSGAADRRPHERDAVAELHACSTFPIRRRRWCMCIPAPTNSAASISPHSPSMPRRPRSARRSKACSRRTRFPGAAKATPRMPTSGLDREGDAATGRRQSRRGHGVAARKFARGFDCHHRRRQFLRLGSPLLSRAQIRWPGRADLRLHGLWLSGGAGEQDALSRSHGGVRCRRRRLPDDGPGFCDRRAIQAAR